MVKQLGLCDECGLYDHQLKEDQKMMYCSRCKMATYCSRECQKKHYKGHKETCAMHSALHSASEAQALKTPSRVVIYQAFEAYLANYPEAIKYALHSAMRIGVDNLHLTHVAFFTWAWEKNGGWGPFSKDFKLLDVHIVPHEEFRVAMRRGRPEDDQSERMVESLCSQEGIAKMASIGPNGKSSHSALVGSFHTCKAPDIEIPIGITYPAVVECVEFADAPSFPVDTQWLKHFRMDIQVAAKKPNDMKQLAMVRSGKMESWLDANEAWFNSRSPKERAILEGTWDENDNWHKERDAHKAAQNARKKARKARSKANAAGGANAEQAGEPLASES